MEQIRFGKTELLVSRIAFGGIPIQRLSVRESTEVVRGAIDLGINFLDTAYGYADSEEKIGIAIKGVPRDELVIASKSPAKDKKTFLEHVDLSLKRLGVDYIDVYQLHYIRSAADFDARMGDGGAYEGLMESIKAGKVRFPAFTSHSIAIGIDIMRTKKFDAVQLPFNFVDCEAVDEAIPLAKELDMGFIGMKPFGGGLLSDAGVVIRYLLQYDNVVPDPGIERLSEIEEIVRIASSDPKFTAADAEEAERIKQEMGTSWCHRCGYCLPCPQNVPISGILTLASFIKRCSYDSVVEYCGEALQNAPNCTACGECRTKCPYDLNIPELIKDNLVLWEQYQTDNRK